MAIICKYKFNSSLCADYLPKFNSEFTGYTKTDVDNGDNTITRTIEHDTLLPTLIRFGGDNATDRERSLLELIECDTSNVTSMWIMFKNCSSLISLDLSSFNTSKVTSMGAMFKNCSSLTSLNISNFNTSKVTNMGEIFRDCTLLTSLDLSNFDTSNVTNMNYMFINCTSLTSLDLSNFDTSKVIYMSGMFYNCSSLTLLNVSNFNTSNVTNMGYMFYNCSSLSSLDLSNFNTSKVTNMSYMFINCTSLTSLDLSSFNTSKVTNMQGMFYNCSSLTLLNVSNFNTSNVTNMGYMFYNCSSLSSLDLSNFNTSKVTNMGEIFRDCTLLTSLDLSNFDTSNVTNMNYMFINCTSLTSLDLSNFDTSSVANTDYMFGNTPKLADIGMVYCTKSTIDKISPLVKHTCNIYVNFVIPDDCTPVEGITFIYDGDTREMNHEPLRAVGDAKDRYVLIDGKWYIERKCGVRAYQEGDKDNYKTDLINTVYPLETPAYEEINYNPLEVYSDTTHITTNSTIPTNITVKNHGFNCLLKPSTTYTISSNLGLNTVTTPSALTEDCLRFYDTDTSDITTMKDVLILEGDWTTKADLIPANFSGMESAFEQEYDAEKGKYKVNAKVVGKNLFDINKIIVGKKADGKINRNYSCSQFIKTVPNTTYYLKNYNNYKFDGIAQYSRNKIDLKSNISLNYDKGKFTTSNNCHYIKVQIFNSLWATFDCNVQLEQGDTATEYEPYKENNITFYLNEPLRGIGDVKDKVYIKDDKVVVERNCGSVTLDGSDDEDWYIQDVNYQSTLAGEKRIYLKQTGLAICDKMVVSPSSSNKRMSIFPIFEGGIDYIRFPNGVNIWSTKQKFREWLQQNPVKLIYPTSQVTYEEVEYDDVKLFIESFKNSTLSYNSNVPVTSTVHYSYSVPIVDTVAQTASISDEQDQLIINLATQVAVLEMMTM